MHTRRRLWTHGPLECVCVDCVVWTWAHHLPAAISLPLPVSVPLSPSGVVAPQEQLSIMDGLGDHIAVSEETWRRKKTQDKQNETEDCGRCCWVGTKQRVCTYFTLYLVLCSMSLLWKSTSTRFSHTQNRRSTSVTSSSFPFPLPFLFSLQQLIENKGTWQKHTKVYQLTWTQIYFSNWSTWPLSVS